MNYTARSIRDTLNLKASDYIRELSLLYYETLKADKQPNQFNNT